MVGKWIQILKKTCAQSGVIFSNRFPCNNLSIFLNTQASPSPAQMLGLAIFVLFCLCILWWLFPNFRLRTLDLHWPFKAGQSESSELFVDSHSNANQNTLEDDPSIYRIASGYVTKCMSVCFQRDYFVDKRWVCC